MISYPQPLIRPFHTFVNLYVSAQEETAEMLQKHTCSCFLSVFAFLCDIVHRYLHAGRLLCLYTQRSHLSRGRLSSVTLSNHQRTKLTNMTPTAILKTVHQLPQLCKILKLDRINTIIIIMYYYYCHHRLLHHHHQNYRHYCHCY